MCPNPYGECILLQMYEVSGSCLQAGTVVCKHSGFFIFHWTKPHPENYVLPKNTPEAV